MGRSPRHPWDAHAGRGTLELSRKRILFISNTSKLGGGTNSYLLTLLAYLNRKYFCAVVSDRHSPQLADALRQYEVPHFALRDRVALYFPTLLARMRLEKFDLVYGNGVNGRSLWAARAAKLLGIPYIWHVHETLKTDRYARELQSCDAVIANSFNTADCVRRVAPGSNPRLIPCGIDSGKYDLDKVQVREELGRVLGLNPSWLRVLNIGRYHHAKNQLDALRVATKVLPRYPNIHFIFIGIVVEPDYRDALETEVKRQGLAGNVIFHDYAPDIHRHLCGSDLLLHTAESEPQGLVILEAMAARLPVAAYDVGGVGESVVQGETGFLRPFGDVQGITEDVLTLLGDAGLRRRMGEAGRRRVEEHFSAEKTAAQVGQVIQEVLHRSGRG